MKQQGKVAFTGGQFARCPVLNKTPLSLLGFFYPFSRLTQVSSLMDDSSLMLFKLIFASRSYSRHVSFYRHVQLFWLVTAGKICALFQICVIIECPRNFLDFVDVSHLCDT